MRFCNSPFYIIQTGCPLLQIACPAILCIFSTVLVSASAVLSKGKKQIKMEKLAIVFAEGKGIFEVRNSIHIICSNSYISFKVQF